MDVSPKTLREVEFREKMRGYHPEDVDQFLEQMAVGVEVLQERMRQAVERAQRAERAASEAAISDETLRRTLVLAQRTADLAIEEAREEAVRIVAAAEQKARILIEEADEQARSRSAEAEEKVKLFEGETIAGARAELARIETARAQAQERVDDLQRWADEHQTAVVTALREALAAVTRSEVLSPAPPAVPVDEGDDRPVGEGDSAVAPGPGTDEDVAGVTEGGLSAEEGGLPPGRRGGGRGGRRRAAGHDGGGW